MLVTATRSHRFILRLGAFLFSAACSSGGMSLPPDDDKPADMSMPPPHDAAMPPDQAQPNRPSALYVVAHQDDDLLFMSPTLARDIQQGIETTTLYLTAGDAGNGEDYWKRREEGAKSAHALIAHTNNDWSSEQISIGGRTLTRYTPTADRSQHLLFLRLPDGNMDGSGFSGKGSLQQLWEGKIGNLSPLDGAKAYSVTELGDFLAAVFTTLQPNVLHIQDNTNLYAPSLTGSDHSDHMFAARFAFAASLRYTKTHALQIHRGYNVQSDRQNLTADEANQKWSIFADYANYDMCYGVADQATCLSNLRSTSYGQWCQVESVVQRVIAVRAALGGPMESCLYAASSAGAGLQMKPCDDGMGQLWDLLPNGQLRNPDGLCVHPRGGVFSDGTLLELAACKEAPEQSFRLLTSGQLMGPNGQCVDIKGASGADGTPVQLRGCEVSAGQAWVQRRRLSFYANSGMEFSDADILSDANIARTTRFADVNGDKKIDACIRKPLGIFCALGDGTGKLAPLQKWSQAQDYSDAAGWQAPSWGLTLQFADINGDGKADVCGRAAGGLFCALSNGSAFQAAALFSQGLDFSDSDGKNVTEEGYYATLRLGDVNGDRKADVCWRKADGMYCALSSGTGFAASRQYTTGFSDAEGYRSPQFADSMAMGDVNGDGRADVCARGVYGVVCIIASLGGDSFAYGNWWTFRNAFSDAEGWNASLGLYGSLRLADIDGDGKQDLCGRSVSGLVCSISSGTRFGPLLRTAALEFADTTGWYADRYGPTLQLADLDGDGRADACGRGTYGLVCIRTATTVP